MASGICFDGMIGVRFDWINFLLDPKLLEQVNNLPVKDKRREIPPPEKFKSRFAGEMGLKLLDTSLLNVIIWYRRAA